MTYLPWLLVLGCWLVLGLGWLLPTGWLSVSLCLPTLIVAVLAAVHHAEVIAHRVKEPFGTLVLALAVTVIEVSLMVSLMLSGGADASALPRDTLFATIMIIVNGVVGICLLVGGLKHHEQAFRVEGTGSAMAALIALVFLTLVLPGFTISSPGPSYSPAQLAFAAFASLAMWGVFVFGQTVKHRLYFQPVGTPAEATHAAPTLAATWASFALLVVALVAVVGLAKLLSPTIESAVDVAGAPKAVIGVAIAFLVLLPETWSAVRAALANQLQTSLNLALGSALASIGLTIPAVALVATILGLPLTLGLEPKEMILLLATFLVGTITLGTGRTNLMQGAVHLVLFAAFLFLAFVP